MEAIILASIRGTRGLIVHVDSKFNGVPRVCPYFVVGILSFSKTESKMMSKSKVTFPFDASNVTWAHAVNSRKELEKELGVCSGIADCILNRDKVSMTFTLLASNGSDVQKKVKE
ncbi:hypothetical protein CDAR_463901 [Caerostris darwini]|uniref:Uncharacterized protein n=1 Tax=Caerostris darwini TaxID=1538125 RepID=A0AAV4V875_9ARAC|nr:hypothetical protein CDAR_463901 [Caerostris darwini]